MDTSSDSSSASWVFVYGNADSPENSTNTFHLDCSREPIQELTEQDLALTSSDAESDRGTDTSDGISIISESEIPLEENCSAYNDCFKIEDTHIIENRIACTNLLCVQQIEESEKDWDWKNVISVGVLVSAVLLAFYSSFKTYKASTFDEVVPGGTLDEIVDKTISCACGDKPREPFENQAIKLCVKRQFYKDSNVQEQDVLRKLESPTFDNPNAAIENRYGDLENPNKIPDGVLHILSQVDSTMKYGQNSVIKNMNETVLQGDKENIKQAEKETSRGKNSQKPSGPKQDRTYEKQKAFNRKQGHKNLSGEWYINMHKQREELRMKNSRVNNKALWYFKRVNARQQARRKYNYRPYSD